MRSLLPRLLLAVIVLGALSACTQPAAVPSQPTAAAQPTSAPAATEAPAATATTAPTATTEATATTPATATTAPTATTAATATTEASPTAASSGGDTSNAPTGQAAFNLLVDSAKAQLAQKAWRVTINGKDENGKDQNIVLEVVRPGSFHMVTAEAEFIVVPEGTFLKQGADGKWEKSPMDMSGLMSQALDEGNIEQQIKDLQPNEIKLVGADIVNGKPTWVYQYTTTQDVGGTKVQSDTKMWIGVADKLPYKAEVSSEVNKANSLSTIMYDYDPNIKIEAPQVSG